MYAVQSALSQIAETLAADMIDLKRAYALMTVRPMSLNFHHHEMWRPQTNPLRSISQESTACGTTSISTPHPWPRTPRLKT